MRRFLGAGSELHKMVVARMILEGTKSAASTIRVMMALTTIKVHTFSASLFLQPTASAIIIQKAVCKAGLARWLLGLTRFPTWTASRDNSLVGGRYLSEIVWEPMARQSTVHRPDRRIDARTSGRSTASIASIPEPRSLRLPVGRQLFRWLPISDN